MSSWFYPELVTFGLRIHNHADLSADLTVEPSSQVCNVAPCSVDSRRHENLLGEKERERDIIPHNSAWLGDWPSYVDQAQGDMYAQQLYENYRSHIEDAWTWANLGPELGANDNAHASASTRFTIFQKT